eukprot:scaffold178330_cov31-Prasinocladus_malaysianus.AAC.2
MTRFFWLFLSSVNPPAAGARRLHLCLHFRPSRKVFDMTKELSLVNKNGSHAKSTSRNVFGNRLGAIDSLTLQLLLVIWQAVTAPTSDF